MITNMYPTRENPAFGAFIKSQIDSIAAAGVEVDVLFINGRKSTWNYVRAIGQMRSMLKQRSYDVVHAHYGLSGIVACAQRRCPVVVSFCGDDLLGTSNGKGGTTFKSRLVVWADRCVARFVQGVIIKSRGMMDALGSAAAREKAVVIPNGVDLDLFRPMDRAQCRAQLGLHPDRGYVLFPSAPLEPVKRIDLARAAVDELKRVGGDVELIVLSGKPQSEVPVYMGACDVLILTSDSEGSPNVVKEAMACNLPVVSVDAGDAWEIIADTAHCYRAERDAKDLADKLSRVLAAGERSNGRERIAHLGIDAVARRVLDVYASVVNGGR